jgi:hypothetical protein
MPSKSPTITLSTDYKYLFFEQYQRFPTPDEQRKYRNKLTAAKHRQKKKKYIESLEEQVSMLAARNIELELENASLKRHKSSHTEAAKKTLCAPTSRPSSTSSVTLSEVDELEMTLDSTDSSLTESPFNGLGETERAKVLVPSTPNSTSSTEHKEDEADATSSSSVTPSFDGWTEEDMSEFYTYWSGSAP